MDWQIIMLGVTLFFALFFFIRAAKKEATSKTQTTTSETQTNAEDTHCNHCYEPVTFRGNSRAETNPNSFLKDGTGWRRIDENGYTNEKCSECEKIHHLDNTGYILSKYFDTVANSSGEIIYTKEGKELVVGKWSIPVLTEGSGFAASAEDRPELGISIGDIYLLIRPLGAHIEVNNSFPNGGSFIFTLQYDSSKPICESTAFVERVGRNWDGTKSLRTFNTFVFGEERSDDVWLIDEVHVNVKELDPTRKLMVRVRVEV